jgi:hypothetical protein
MSESASYEGRGPSLQAALDAAAAEMPTPPEGVSAVVQEIRVTTGGTTGGADYAVFLISA